MPREARTNPAVRGECVYRTTDPANQYTVPSGWGRDSQETTAVGGLRIAVQSWSHNDTTLGHSGTDCADTNCYWPTGLRVTTRQAEGAISTPCGVAFPDEVVIYEAANFSGRCRILGVGEYARPDAFRPVRNDTISSIQVGADVSVTLFQAANFGGVQRTFQPGQYPNLSAFRFNDRVSSMKVQPR
jgi:hypothetical protein